MRYAWAWLLLGVAFNAPAQDSCGHAAIEALEKAPPQSDAATQARMDRLLMNLKQGYAQCLKTLGKIEARQQTVPLLKGSPLPSPNVQSTCTVVNESGVPCLRKTSEKMGLPNTPDEAVFSNTCHQPLLLTVVYKNSDRVLKQVKAHETATLWCKNCGGVASTELSCPKD